MQNIRENKKQITQIILTVLLFILAHVPNVPQLGQFIIYLVAYLIIGASVIKEAVEHLFQGKWFDENFLMMIATVGAFLVKQYPEAVAVMLFYKIGELFEHIAVERSRRSITQLLDIRPEYANLQLETGKTKRVSPAEVKIADMIVVKPGERVPLDGIVVSGEAYLDTAALTGESEPRLSKKDTAILSGSIVQNSILVIKVTKEYGESTVAKILELVENASQQKAPTEKFITKFSQVYTPIVVGLALLLALVPPFLLGQPFETWFYRALVFLVISCPCALVISIPLGFFGGIGAASKQGVLVKGSNYLELLTKIKTLVFDKTGTLTLGQFVVAKVYPSANTTEAEVIKLAALAEQHSPHPIARSIVEYYLGNLTGNEVSEVKEVIGAGVKASYQGKELLVGKAKLLQQEKIKLSQSIPETPGSLVYVAYEGKYLGCLVIEDALKPSSQATIAQLKARQIKPVMLTGDRQQSARLVADKLGITEVKAELLPQDKLEYVQKLQQTTSGKVGFVGDGLNDTPVLTSADVGIAMGALGSDAAIEAADVVLMTDDPAAILSVLKVAQKTKQIVWQNICLALGIKLIFLILGAFGDVSMWEAVFADVGVTLLAVLNTLRIFYRQK
ncbi:heavy metal translocating P-type ATPase [Ligilactobacillus apodemi]|uniref:heavy metal translocating P-type ATPase n=1 Tax=Ligilactobacillus apodemi TaxID=307126 RepID=UPI00214B5E83|nr:heavy metal translocating P-type ATPase [Ligilactobacillus apodemi]MCR1901799.1 heavy metal translocating P-type ATPase [Ligilactobacillus apodemi]